MYISTKHIGNNNGGDANLWEFDEAGKLLLVEVLGVYNKILVTEREMKYNFRLVDDWFREISGGGSGGDRFGELTFRLRESVDKLRKLDKDYKKLRQKVNLHYGSELLTSRSSTPSWKEMLRRLEDGKGWGD
jgi:hypothetical protein